jgi:hypothetical protein
LVKDLEEPSNSDVKSDAPTQEESKLEQPTIKELETIINPNVLVPGTNPFAKTVQTEKTSVAVI